YRVVFNHKALQIDQFKTGLTTLRLPNANVHLALRIPAASESRHITKKMTRPTKQSGAPLAARWIASRSLSSGAHSRDPLARNDDRLRLPVTEQGEMPHRRHRPALSDPHAAVAFGPFHQPLPGKFRTPAEPARQRRKGEL